MRLSHSNFRKTDNYKNVGLPIFIETNTKDNKMKILLLGATGNVGGNLLKAALDRGDEVLAIARHPENIATKHENLQIKNVNMFDENVLAEELQGKDALVSCLGGSWSWFNRKPVTIYTDSVKVFANALRRSGVNRLIVMSSWHLEGEVPFWLKAARFLGVRNLGQNMKDMEIVLKEKCSDIDYTAVKMCMGNGQDDTGKPILTHEGESVPGASGCISYGDTSRFILDSLKLEEWKKKCVAIGTK